MSAVSIHGWRFPRIALALATVALGLAAFSSAAQACSYPDAEQVFSRWDDNNYYELAPDGGFEGGGSGWVLRGGAEVVEGNESLYLNGAEDNRSLSLPWGSSATSPRVCVDDTTPGFRLMNLNDGDGGAKLRVLVTYEMADPKTRTTDIRADDEWGPSKLLKLDIDGDRERVARITLAPRDDEGAWLIDDLYVDPFARH